MPFIRSARISGRLFVRFNIGELALFRPTTQNLKNPKVKEFKNPKNVEKTFLIVE